MKNEGALQAKCLKHARFLGVWGRKVETPSYRGFPDTMYLWQGRVMLIEFKHPNGKGTVSPLQGKDHERLRAVGVPVYVVDSFEAFQFLLDNFRRDTLRQIDILTTHASLSFDEAEKLLAAFKDKE